MTLADAIAALTDLGVLPVISLAATNARKGINLAGSGYVDCRISHLPLMPNIYTIQVKVSGDVMVDLVENAAVFTVKAPPRALVNSANMGIVYVDPEWQFT